MPTDPGYHDIVVERRGHVDIVTINRPQARNALTHTTYAELQQAVETTGARCVVITGTDPAFCSGDDVKQIMMKAGDSDGTRPSTTDRLTNDPRLTPAAGALLYTDVPVIAAVNGAAVGWGMELALMADIRVASERARFGELFVLRGLCCDVAGIGRLAQLVGREAAAELLFTGRVIDAAEAKDLRLVSRVVAHDDLLPTALALADQIASNPPLAVAELKAGLRLALDPDWNDLGRWVSSTLGRLFRTDDHKEGVAAFVEKRAAVYRGRLAVPRRPPGHRPGTHHPPARELVHHGAVSGTVRHHLISMGCRRASASGQVVGPRRRVAEPGADGGAPTREHGNEFAEVVTQGLDDHGTAPIGVDLDPFPERPTLGGQGDRTVGTGPDQTALGQASLGGIEVGVGPRPTPRIRAHRQAPVALGQQTHLGGIDTGGDPRRRVYVTAELTELIGQPPGGPEIGRWAGLRTHAGIERPALGA